MRVLNDNVMVKVHNAGPQTTAAGLYIPETQVNTGQVITGEVVSVGKGKWSSTGERTPVDLKVGDTIWFQKFNAFEVEDNGEKFYVLPESNVLAVK